MNPIVKNVLVVLGSLFAGSLLNMGILILGGSIIPVPEGVDPMNAESISANIHLFEAKHFIFPFLAHALGTLLGAFLVAKFAASRNMQLAFLIGALFMVGGVMNAFNLGGPLWFDVLDIVVAYLPMAWLGGRLGIGDKATA